MEKPEIRPPAIQIKPESMATKIAVTWSCLYYQMRLLRIIQPSLITGASRGWAYCNAVDRNSWHSDAICTEHCGSFSVWNTTPADHFQDRSPCVASRLPIYRNYAYQWRVFKDDLDYDLHRLKCVELAAKSADVTFYEPIVWNGMSSVLRDGSPLNAFGRHLKSYIFRQSWASLGAVARCDVFYDSGAVYKCHDLLTYFAGIEVQVIRVTWPLTMYVHQLV